jgi:hypothetical protein
MGGSTGRCVHGVLISGNVMYRVCLCIQLQSIKAIFLDTAKDFSILQMHQIIIHIPEDLLVNLEIPELTTTLE